MESFSQRNRRRKSAASFVGEPSHPHPRAHSVIGGVLPCQAGIDSGIVYRRKSSGEGLRGGVGIVDTGDFSRGGNVGGGDVDFGGSGGFDRDGYGGGAFGGEGVGRGADFGGGGIKGNDSSAIGYASYSTGGPSYSQGYGHNNHGGGAGGGRDNSRLTDLQGPMGTRGSDSRAMHDSHLVELYQQGFSTGLAKALAENANVFDFRFWIVDNSGSMQIGDGHRLVTKDDRGGGRRHRGSRTRHGRGGGDVFNDLEGGSGYKSLKSVPSTRWEEIQDVVKYHAHMAALLDSPTIFKLINDPGLRTGPQQFSIGERGEAGVAQDINVAIRTMQKAKPGGVTPLTKHIWELQRSVAEMAPQLAQRGKKVAIILATDGLPTDEQGYGGDEITQEFVTALRSLEGLPVWLVVRLCTDEEPVTRFYNSLDGQLEMSLEVIDDFRSEAREVYAHNPWICYGLPLHRCRELGYHDRVFDLIDERPLTKGEARSFCCLIFGVDDDDEMSDPANNFVGFLKEVQIRLKSEQLQWNPIKKKNTPWILTSVLARSFSNEKCAIM